MSTFRASMKNTMKYQRFRNQISCISIIASATLCAMAQTSAVSAGTNAPTVNTLAPEQIDAQWIAANSKYDNERTRILGDVDRAVDAGPFRDDWQSLRAYQAPEWFRDAKFGIFIHWGVYSVAGFGSEWYSRNMYQQGSSDFTHHLATYGPQTTFGYKDLIPKFTAEHFDPDVWAKLFHDAGARYVVPVAEHHDGFPMYESNLTDWCAGKMGPKRDVLGELAKAVRAEGMHLGASSHRAEHDWFFDGGRQFASDVNDPKYAAFYGPAQISQLDGGNSDALIHDYTYVSPAFMDDWLARTAEIVQRYHPELIYFDWWVGQPDFRTHLARFATYYYNQAAAQHQPVVLFYKLSAMADGAATLDVERGALTGIRPQPWQTDTSLSNASWGYVQGDTYKSPEMVIHQLVDVVSKNGNLLMNVGPRPDGTIPEGAAKTLLAVGAWLKVNGDAIYGTRPWRQFGEGPTQIEAGQFHDSETKPYTAEDFRFTTKGDALYAIELSWPKGGEAVIHALDSGVGTREIASVDLLGSTAPLTFQQKPDGLHIHVPAKPVGQYAYAYRITWR
ncbi:MAG TPA: alpha-L-fucosidase [Acidobacteriaceae bacterium]